MFTATQQILRAVPSLDPHTVAKSNAKPNERTSTPPTQDVAQIQRDPATQKAFYRGRAFRRACAVSTAAPVLAATHVAMDVVRPAISGVSRLAYAVAGPAVGVVGASLGALVGAISSLAPVAGGIAGYRVGRCIVGEALKYASRTLVFSAKLAQMLLVTLAAYLGYAIGSVVTAPLVVLGKRSAA